MFDLSDEKKQGILVECARMSDPHTGALMHGALKNILATFHPVSKRTVMRLRSRYGAQKAQGNMCPTVANMKKGRCGNKSKLTDGLKLRYKAIIQHFANNLRWCSVRPKVCFASLGYSVVQSNYFTPPKDHEIISHEPKN